MVTLKVPISGPFRLSDEYRDDLTRVVTGVIESGKDTFCKKAWGRGADFHTDSLADAGVPFSEQSKIIAEHLEFPDSPFMIYCGVAMPRGLRKYRELYGDQVPIDRMYVFSDVFPWAGTLAKGQQTMNKQIMNQIREIEPWLKDRIVWCEWTGWK